MEKFFLPPNYLPELCLPGHPFVIRPVYGKNKFQQAVIYAGRAYFLIKIDSKKLN